MEAKRGNDKKLRSLRSFNIASLIEWFMMKFVVIVSPHFTSSAFVLFGCTILGAALRDFTIVQKMWGNLSPSRFLTSPTNSCIIRDGWHPFCTPISINLLILSWNDQSIFAILFTFHEPEKHQSAFCYYHKVYKWPLRIGPTITITKSTFFLPSILDLYTGDAYSQFESKNPRPYFWCLSWISCILHQCGVDMPWYISNTTWLVVPLSSHSNALLLVHLHIKHGIIFNS